MALDKQQIPLSFSKGIDTKTDSKQVIAGKLLTLENASLRKIGKFVKRYGFGVLADTTSLSNGNSINTFKNELISLDGEKVYSYSVHNDSQYEKGNKLSIDLSTQSIVRNSYEQTQPDSAIHSSGVSVYSWQDSSGGIRYSVFDTVTGQSLVSNGVVSLTGSKTKVKTIGTYVLIFFYEGTVLKYFKVDTTLPTSTFAAVTLVTSYTADFDVQFISNKLVVAYPSSITDTSLFSISTTLVQSADYTVVTPSTIINVFGDTSNNVWVTYVSGLDIQYFIVDFALSSTLLAPTVVDTGIVPFTNVTGVYSGSSAVIFYENPQDEVSNYFTRKNTATFAGTVGTPADFIRSVGLYSKAFIQDSNVYIVVTHESELQSTYFMVNESGSVVAKIAPSLGGGLSTTGLLAEVNTVTADVLSFAFEFKDFVTSVNGDVTTQTGVNSAFLTFGEQTQLEVIGNNLHMSGGIISMYDGQNIVEKGFNLYPEGLVGDSTYGGGTLSTGKYQYSAVYEWQDSQGQIHRSAPSIPVTINTENTFTFFQAQSQGGTRNYFALFPSVTGESIEDSLKQFRVGNEVTGLTIPVGTYVTHIVDQRDDPAPQNSVYVFLSQSFTHAPSEPFTVTVKSNYGFVGSSTLGSNLLNANQTSYGSYFGSGTSGDTTLILSTTVGIYPGMSIWNLTDVFGSAPTILSIAGNEVVLSSAPSADFSNRNIWVNQPLITPAGTASVSSYSISIPPFGLHYYIGQQIFMGEGNAPQNASASSGLLYISGITKLPTTWIISFSANIVYSPTRKYFAGVDVTHNLSVNQSITTSAGFSSPRTIESITLNDLELDEKAAAASSGLIVGSNQGFSGQVTIPTLRVTEKVSSSVSIALYRTVSNGTVFYRVNPATQETINDITVDSVTVLDSVSDENIVGNEQLYTTGGELENISPPASSVTGTFKNRLLLRNDEDKLSFWYSKKVQTNTPPEFTDAFTTRVPERGGDIEAFQQLDDKLIIFKEDLIFAQVGDGPAATGINNDFSDPQVITSDNGCISKKSIVIIPSGIIYQSQKGFYLLDRSLNINYIGADVESYNESIVTSSKLMEDINQVRFTLSSGVALVYDYFLSQWDVFTGINAADSAVYDNKFTYILPSGEIRKENSTFTDDEALIPIKIETGWINLAGLQGFHRIYKLIILGEYKSPHTLTVQLYRDFATTPFQTVTIPVLSAPDKYQFRVFPDIQKMESFKIKITETQAGPPYGEGFEISSIAIEAGIKRGLNKLSKDVSYG